MENLVTYLVFNILGFSDENMFAHVLHFFIYDSIKIMLMLFIMISIIGFLRSYINQARLKRWLSARPLLAHFSASVLGAVTPFCSCSGIPIFLSLVNMGIPLGITFSFLVTSPLVNEYLLVLMIGFFGWKIAVLYLLSGMLVGIIVGMVLGKFGLEKYLERDITSSASDEKCDIQNTLGFYGRVMFGVNEALRIIKKLWLWVLFGVAVGAVIHNYVPQEAIQNIMQKTGFWAVPIAVLLGVPMYGSCAAIVPIAVVLFNKGVLLGTALAFMMATAGLSLPEAILLKRAMKPKLILIFFGFTSIAIMLTGFMFNIIQNIM